MQNTTEALTWIVDAHLEVSRLYRLAIERELWHVQRIFGSKLSDEAKKLLKQSVKEISIPDYPKPDNKELVSNLYHLVPKPNFTKIRQEYLSLIDDL